MRCRAFLAAVALTIGIATPAAAQTDGQITYRGVTFSVPHGWPVYHLTAHQCVRLDRHAVYLGTPGADQDCPANLIGRTETLLVQPYHGRAVTPDSDSVQGRRDGLLFTASIGAAGRAAARALLPPSVRAVRAAAVPAATRPAVDLAPTIVRGAGFDACRAPSKSAMHAWANSSAPYKAIGIYIGGLNRGCPYGNLSAIWVSTVHKYGYRFIPTYVGRQAPCSGVGIPIRPTAATSEGLDAARDALHNMAKFGFPKGSPVYLDMENYVGDDSCKRAVLQFVSAWVYRLHLSGYRAGLYTSSWASIVRHHNDGRFRNPDVIWIGRWNDKRSVFGDPVVPDNFWAHHQRIHQYRGSHAVRYGGVTLTIDTDELDTPVG